ncbi:putative chitinase [Herbaspirillum sp. Sphag1AN]|uniref:glycoside hydrolase family 19 protein n=1 Tax=unclassified Herbaspirillum TaxID=2624150 RepID=UPI0016161950|nr:MULTISPECIES: hypothetical protein [unclassified Herbaspirillum]MBB3213702.1 putative chitinase [Herbaspirillum sp. Sphag1AN]MBB3246899.1 putative chitinase [Herbaspirillum sp. Sphag64]
MSKALRRAICQFPTEWDRGTIIARYGCLNEMEFGAKNRADRWARFENHARAVSFDGLPQEYKDAQWHFHPTEFIKHFRKCGWLSEAELVRLYPDSAYASFGKKAVEYINLYEIPLNKIMRKYGLTNATRQAHFLGQVAVETYYMMAIREVPIDVSRAIKNNHIMIRPENNGFIGYEKEDLSKYSYFNYLELKKNLGNTSPGDGLKFRGRGFKQLTGRYNYSEYWVFRGWLDRRSYIADWFAHYPYLQGPVIDKPEDVANSPWNAVDTAAFFWIRYKVYRAADHGVDEKSSYSVTAIVNKKTDVKSYRRRLDETFSAWLILGTVV